MTEGASVSRDAGAGLGVLTCVMLIRLFMLCSTLVVYQMPPLNV